MPKFTHTYTYAILALSQSAFQEIRDKLRASYGVERESADDEYGVVVDVSGLAVAADKSGSQVDLPLTKILEGLGEQAGLPSLFEVEAAVIKRTLRLLEGSLTKTAEALGIDGRTLLLKLEQMKAKAT